MNQLEVFEKIVKEVFDIEILKDELNPDDVENWDSITHMDLCAKFEDEFDVSLDVEDIAEMETIGEMKNILRKYGIDL